MLLAYTLTLRLRLSFQILHPLTPLDPYKYVFWFKIRHFGLLEFLMKTQTTPRGCIWAQKGVACCTPTSFPSSLAMDYSLVWWDPQPQKIVTTLPIACSSSCSLLLSSIEGWGYWGTGMFLRSPGLQETGFLEEDYFGGSGLDCRRWKVK